MAPYRRSPDSPNTGLAGLSSGRVSSLVSHTEVSPFLDPKLSINSCANPYPQVKMGEQWYYVDHKTFSAPSVQLTHHIGVVGCVP